MWLLKNDNEKNKYFCVLGKTKKTTKKLHLSKFGGGWVSDPPPIFKSFLKKEN